MDQSLVLHRSCQQQGAEVPGRLGILYLLVMVMCANQSATKMYTWIMPLARSDQLEAL